MLREMRGRREDWRVEYTMLFISISISISIQCSSNYNLFTVTLLKEFTLVAKKVTTVRAARFRKPLVDLCKASCAKSIFF